MNKPDPRELVDRALDRELSASEFDELEQALRQSQSLRRRFLRQSRVSAELEWEFSSLASLDALCKDALIADKRANNRETTAISPLAYFWSGFFIAASLLCVAGATLWWFTNLTLVNDGATVVASETVESNESTDVVATLTGAVDCIWADGAERPMYGAAVKPGQEIELLSGYAQLTFESGAKVVLEGPAKFTPHREMYAALSLGKAAAVVPHDATGFQIDTPSAEIVDLGTAFGIDVALSGETEIHVLEGEVLSRAIASQSEDAFVHLVQDKALRYSPNSPDFTTIEAARDRFVTDVRPLLLPQEIPELPVQRSLALWLSADSLIEKDDAGRVVAWGDIRTADNQTDETAWQSKEKYRPLWIESAIHGQPAVRFDGKLTHLVTTLLATTNEQTVFIVFAQHGQFPDALPHQLLSYNGPPVRELSDITDPGVLQIDDIGKPGHFQGRVHVRAKGPRLSDHSKDTIYFDHGVCIDPDPVVLNQPAALTYVYARRDNLSELWMNGELKKTSTAFFPIAINSRKVIGKHGKPNFSSFSGDIAEVLIFNDRLTHDEIVQINDYLKNKYGLSGSLGDSGK